MLARNAAAGTKFTLMMVNCDDDNGGSLVAIIVMLMPMFHFLVWQNSIFFFLKEIQGIEAQPLQYFACVNIGLFSPKRSALNIIWTAWLAVCAQQSWAEPQGSS